MWPALAGSVESDCRVLDDLDPLVVFGVDETGEPIGRDLHKFTAGIRERGLHLRAGRAARSFPEAGTNPTAQRLCTLNSCDGSVMRGFSSCGLPGPDGFPCAAVRFTAGAPRNLHKPSYGKR